MIELKPCPLVAVFGDPELEEQALARCPNRAPDPRVEKLVAAARKIECAYKTNTERKNALKFYAALQAFGEYIDDKSIISPGSGCAFRVGKTESLCGKWKSCAPKTERDGGGELVCSGCRNVLAEFQKEGK